MWYSNRKKRHLFLDICSTNTDTFVPSLYQCVETRSTEVFWLWSQPLPHVVGHHLRLSNVLEGISRPSCEPSYATFLTVNKKYFVMNVLFIGPYAHKNAQQNSALRYYTPQARSPFWLLKPPSEHGHARLLANLSRSWAVLLPSDTHRKLVLLPFVTYLLTLPRTWTIPVH
jgi:hypothetical protein